MVTDGSLSTVTEVVAVAVSPAASVIFRVKEAVPVPEAVHVGALAVVLENEPDAPDSDQAYVYGEVPPLTEDDRVTDWPTSIEVVEEDMLTDGAEFTVIVAVPDVALSVPPSSTYHDFDPVEPKVCDTSHTDDTAIPVSVTVLLVEILLP
jgi:hypothetical protein